MEWSISPNTLGSIENGNYTAPKKGEPEEAKPGAKVVITATSRTEPIKTAEATVTLVDNPNGDEGESDSEVEISPTIVPRIDELELGKQITFQLEPKPEQPVKWIFESIARGTLTEEGVYTAPEMNDDDEVGKIVSIQATCSDEETIFAEAKFKLIEKSEDDKP